MRKNKSIIEKLVQHKVGQEGGRSGEFILFTHNQ